MPAPLSPALSTLFSARIQLNTVLLDKPQVVDLALCCLIADGHLLIEDRPGVGKTRLAQALAGALGLAFKRVQCTSDLLPADVLGSVVYSKAQDAFTFRKGAVFTQVFMADELNRAPSKTQSALLEAMEERQISAEGTPHALGAPFLVLATQNPLSQIGTFPLPESQLDRFLMRLSIGLPSPQAERSLLLNRSVSNAHHAEANAETVLAAQAQARAVHLSDAMLDYLQALIAATRQHPRSAEGLSPRGAIALAAATRAWAWLAGRDYAMPEDAQAVFAAVVGHRIKAKVGASSDGLVQEILLATAV